MTFYYRCVLTLLNYKKSKKIVRTQKSGWRTEVPSGSRIIPIMNRKVLKTGRKASFSDQTFLSHGLNLKHYLNIINNYTTSASL